MFFLVVVVVVFFFVITTTREKVRSPCESIKSLPFSAACSQSVSLLSRESLCCALTNDSLSLIYAIVDESMRRFDATTKAESGGGKPKRRRRRFSLSLSLMNPIHSRGNRKVRKSLSPFFCVVRNNGGVNDDDDEYSPPLSLKGEEQEKKNTRKRH